VERGWDKLRWTSGWKGQADYRYTTGGPGTRETEMLGVGREHGGVVNIKGFMTAWVDASAWRIWRKLETVHRNCMDSWAVVHWDRVCSEDVLITRSTMIQEWMRMLRGGRPEK
jgi:hypothetical protein